MKKIIPLIILLSLFGCGDEPQLDKIPIIKAEEIEANTSAISTSSKKKTPERLNQILVEILKYKNTPTLRFNNQMNVVFTSQKVTEWYAKNLQNLENSDFNLLGKDNENLIQYLQDQTNWTNFMIQLNEDSSIGEKYNGKKFKDLIMDLR